MENFTVRTCLKSYVNKDGEQQIEIVVHYKGNKYRHPLAMNVSAVNFKNGRVSSTKKAANLNAIIDAKESSIRLALLDLARKNDLSEKTIKGIINPAKKMDFYAFCEMRIEQLRPSRTFYTLRYYTSNLRKVKEFYPGPLPFSRITAEWLSDFQAWMIEKGNKNNSIWNIEKFLSRMLADAVPEYIKENPMRHFDRTHYVEEIPRFLLPDEIVKLETLVGALADGVLKRAGMYFLADMEIGLRITDLESFDLKKDIQDGRILKQTSKKKTIVSFKVSGKLQDYLSYMEANPLDMVPKEYDRQLKILGKLTGIKTILSSHVARHTLGKRLAKAKVPIAVAQQILGHKSIQSTGRYYHLDNEDLDAAIDALK